MELDRVFKSLIIRFHRRVAFLRRPVFAAEIPTGHYLIASCSPTYCSCNALEDASRPLPFLAKRYISNVHRGFNELQE